MIQQQQSSELEELQRRQQTKLQAQLQALEEALSKRVEKMEQVTLSVEKLEEQRRFLLADQQQCALLQDRVAQLGEFLPHSDVSAFVLYRVLHNYLQHIWLPTWYTQRMQVCVPTVFRCILI